MQQKLLEHEENKWVQCHDSHQTLQGGEVGNGALRRTIYVRDNEGEGVNTRKREYSINNSERHDWKGGREGVNDGMGRRDEYKSEEREKRLGGGCGGGWMWL